jgi:tetratricopeptide (TPR) repeat protein
MSWSRTLNEIKSSGYLAFAVSDHFFHYTLAQKFAESIGVKPKFVWVYPGDYFKKDIVGNPLLLSDVDIYAGHILLPAGFKNRVLFAPLFPTIKVCVYRARTSINALDVTKIKAGLLEEEDKQASDCENQIRNLQIGSIDFIIMDSDLALYYSKKNMGLSVNIDILKDLALIHEAGWVFPRENIDLKKVFLDFVKSEKTNHAFYTLWEHNYEIPYKEYEDTLNIISQRGDDLFRKSLDYAFNKQYSNSLTLLQSVKKMNLASERIERLYDTIYINWLKDTKGIQNQISILDSYMKSDFSDYFIRYLKEKHPGLLRQYLASLKKEREQSLKNRRISEAIAAQAIISSFNPDTAVEKQIYDDIYLVMLESSEESNSQNSLELLENYVKEKPSTYFFRKLKKKLPSLYNDYLNSLQTEQNNALRIKDLDRAEKLQETIFSMNPDSFEEMNKLAILRNKNKILKLSANQEKEMPEEETLNFIQLQSNNLYEIKTLPNENQVNIEKIINEGEKAIENYEGERYYRLGILYFEEKNYTEALSAFQSAKSMSYRTNESFDYINKIIAILEQKEKEKNEAKLKNFNEFFGKAISYFLKEDYSQALESILACLNLFPENQEAKKYSRIISDNLYLEGEKTIASSSPYYYFYLNRMNTAEVLITERKYGDAKKILEEILSVFPNHEITKQKLIFCLLKLDPSVLNKIQKDYFEEAKILIKQEKLKEANIKFSLIKKLNSDFPEIDKYLDATKTVREELPRREKTSEFKYEETLNQANKLYEKGNLTESLRLYKRILDFMPDDYKAIVNSSRIENQIMLQKNQGNTKYTASPIREKAENFYLKGQFYFRIKEYKKALEMWEESCRIDSSYRKAFIDIKRVKKILAYLE